MYDVAFLDPFFTITLEMTSLLNVIIIATTYYCSELSLEKNVYLDLFLIGEIQ